MEVERCQTDTDIEVEAADALSKVAIRSSDPDRRESAAASSWASTGPLNPVSAWQGAGALGDHDERP